MGAVSRTGGRRALSRRTAMISAVAGTAAAGLGLVGDSEARIEQVGNATRLGRRANVSVQRVYSQARNRDVELVTMVPESHVRPDGTIPRNLPVCLMLHGRFGDARDSVLSLPDHLSHAVSAGAVPPFAFLAVDGGGNNYWHERNGDDPMWMLLDEVPRWLGERGLGGRSGQPFAVAGISMGGFGALLYARRRREHGIPLEAAAVISPALLTSWREMNKRHAFTDARQWGSLDPLRHVQALGDARLGVWCGTEDPFIKGTREFIRKARPEVASTSPGGHNSRYYRKALPGAVRFAGGSLPSRHART